MAKVTFTSDINIKPQRQTFPKLSKLKTGQKVRIQLMDVESIEMEWVHTLEVPELDNGQPVYKEDGKLKTRYKGNPLSFGDLSILEDKGLDEKNCPMSKMAKEHPDWVSPPKRKFAMHIIEYRTKPGTFELATPFNVEHKIWVFTEKTYLKLQEYQKEWEDLRLHDLYITCENEKFQQYDITVAPKAAWRENDENGKFTVETYRAGLKEYPDLSAAIGAQKKKEWVIKDLEEIEEAWRTITGAQAKPSGISEQSLDDVLGNDFGKPTASSSDDTGDLLAGLADAGAPESKSEDSPTDDFDSLLAGLGK